MKLCILLLALCIYMQVSIAAEELHKESIPACGEAFLVTDQYPNYYNRQIKPIYEALKNKDSKDIWQAIYPKLLMDSQQLGQNRVYFQRCVTRKYDKKGEENLQLYAKCRYSLPSDMLEPTSKAFADNLGDTTAGLKKAYEALQAKYKNIRRVKRFASCIKV